MNQFKHTETYSYIGLIALILVNTLGVLPGVKRGKGH